MKNFAIILSGCGNRDGSEITEVVSTMIALSEMGAHYTFFSPEIDIEAVNHLTSSANGIRNTLTEAARMARGMIQPLINLNPQKFDGLVIPGGMGAAKTLSTFATAGAKGKVLPQLESTIQQFYQDSKPIAAICIAPAILALCLGKYHVTLTLGAEGEAATEIRKTGAIHEVCSIEDYISDREHKIITTPAYMYDHARPDQVFRGVRAALKEFFEMA